MSRSILVIDTPENCYNCGVRRGYMCGGVSESFGIGKTLSTDLHKPDWCPLKKLSRKSLIGIDGASGIEEIKLRSAQDGYNACIDEILKERDES